VLSLLEGEDHLDRQEAEGLLEVAGVDGLRAHSSTGDEGRGEARGEGRGETRGEGGILYDERP
jgi:hypothetical protein